MSVPRREPMEDVDEVGGGGDGDWRQARARRAQARREPRDRAWEDRFLRPKRERLFKLSMMRKMGGRGPEIDKLTPDDYAEAETQATELTLVQPAFGQTELPLAEVLASGLYFVRGRAPNLTRLVLDLHNTTPYDGVSSETMREIATEIRRLGTVKTVHIIPGSRDEYMEDFWVQFIKENLEGTGITVTVG